jgi:hypothetical protein
MKRKSHSRATNEDIGTPCLKPAMAPVPVKVPFFQQWDGIVAAITLIGRPSNGKLLHTTYPHGEESLLM